jgi:23S rRNA pseudouridine1911/1915/1917 synthase
VIVFARHVRATRRLAEQFEGRMVRKLYWALVEGWVPDDQAIWRDFMRKVPDEPRAEIVDRKHPEARLAVLRFRVQRRFEAATLLEIELETGRTHQIRLQMATRGYPIVGDRQYGARDDFGPLTEDIRERCIALHAQSLSFRHPMNREPVHVTAPLPQPWIDWGAS